ncbi:MAG: DnaJ domain-containing protein [Leptospira sp.]|nr:DnaJ domain-containing protein [Leptospira sp.]
MSLVRKETLYEILGMERTANLSEIRTQFLALREFWEKLETYSPELVKEKIIELNYAYSVLTNPSMREKYDRGLDFEFVLLDGKPKDEDILEAYSIYKQNHQKSYKVIFEEFQNFKYDLSDTLWLLKSTTLYLLLSLFFYSSILIFSSVYAEEQNIQNNIFEKLEIFIIPTYFLLTTFGYYFIYNFYQLPYLKRRRKIVDNSIDS